jgi:hypothetical protein
VTGKKFAPNGLLSGMTIPAVAGAAVLLIGLFFPSLRARFGSPLTPELRWIFLASIVVMILHKVESYGAGEFDVCPTYLNTERKFGGNVRKAMFLSFVPTFLGMLVVTYLAFVGPPWHLLLLTVWLAQGVHELHHSAKSAARGRLYPGVFTSVLFVGVTALLMYPRWWDQVLGARGPAFPVFYALLPFVWAAFYFEDKRWQAGTDESIWNPSRAASRPGRPLGSALEADVRRIPVA